LNQASQPAWLVRNIEPPFGFADVLKSPDLMRSIDLMLAAL
jgi:hypothetical protein